MTVPFKFRYASRMAGILVVLATALLVVGIIVAGRAQGWLEGRFAIVVSFKAEENTLGLLEGNEVWVRNALAGHVSAIAPTEEGQLQATLTIKERFHSFVRTDSVATIKRKLVLGGDAFIEVSGGRGELVRGGGSIECRREEDIAETAKKALTDIQNEVMPILQRVREITTHVSGITAGIDRGDGPVGVLLKDPGMATELKRMAVGVNGLLQESQLTMFETRRLIRGMQQHWLLRKYVARGTPENVFSPAQVENMDLGHTVERWANDLKEARMANDREAIAQSAVNLAYCLMAAGRPEEIDALAGEARRESESGGLNPVRVYLLQAESLKRKGDVAGALAVLEQNRKAVDDVPRDVESQWYLLTAALQAAAGDLPRARKNLDEGLSLGRKEKAPEFKAMLAGYTADVRAAEGNGAAAGAEYDRQAALLSEAGLYHSMAAALEKAAASYAQAGDGKAAADRYFRAGRSRLAARDQAAGAVLDQALKAARDAGDEALARQIQALPRGTNDTTTASAPPPAAAPVAAAPALPVKE